MGKEVNVEPALEQGAFFGELAILFNCRRTATVRSNNYCTFAQINKNIFKRQCSHFIAKIKNHTIQYQDMLKKFKIKLLKQVEYFETYETESNPMFFEEIQYHMKEKSFAQGDEIIHLKQKCKEITWIIEGEVDIEIHNNQN